LRLQRLDVEPVLDRADDGLHGVAAVFEEILAPALERTRVHPAELGVELRAGAGQRRLQAHERTAATDVDIVRQHQGDGLRAEGLLARAVEGPDLFHRRDQSGGQGQHTLAHAHHAACDLSAEPAEVVQRGVLGLVGPVDPLHREPELVEVVIAADVHRLQMAEQRRPLIPGRVLGVRHDIVAVERADRDEGDVLDAEPRQKLLERLADLLETRPAPADEVHLVDGDDDVRDAQQRSDGGVAAALLDDAGARIDEHDGEVGRGGARHHVARVLHVAGRIGDDEAAARRGKIPVGDVDGDALLALGAQAIGEVGEVDLAGAGDIGGALQRLDLILHERL